MVGDSRRECVLEDSTSPSAGWKGEKRGKSSVTNRMLDDRDAQLDAKENACGQQAIWRHIYDPMKCDSPACHLGLTLLLA